MSIEKRIEELGYHLPDPPKRGGVYTPARIFADNLVYVSGCGPATADYAPPMGKLGKAVSLEEGQEAALHCILNLLAAVKDTVGDLSRIKRFVKLLVFVASDNDFLQQPQTANGASQFLVDIFGEEIGLAARSAVGVNVLPGDIPVEIEALIELCDEGRDK